MSRLHKCCSIVVFNEVSDDGGVKARFKKRHSNKVDFIFSLSHQQINSNQSPMGSIHYEPNNGWC